MKGKHDILSEFNDSMLFHFGASEVTALYFIL